MAFPLSSPSSANDVLTSHSSNQSDPHIPSSSSDNQDHTSASPSQEHCHTSLSAVDKNCQTSPSPDTDRSNMTSPIKGTPAIASALVLETTKTPQSRLGFLSLPPEIRNMIYSFLFTPVQDGTCWGVRAKFMDASLSGVRLPCYLCSKGSVHTFCTSVHAQQITTATAYTAFTLPNKHIHSNIHQTCRTIMKESRASSLAHMLISIKCIFNLASPVHDSFNQFLVNMGSPTGAYLAGLSCTSYDGGEPNYKPDCYRSLSTFINEKRIKIGHLELKECWVSDYKPISMLEFFVDFLQSLDHKPATVRWQKSDFESDPSYKGEMDALNNVVGTWLEATSIAKAKRSNLKMPALRDFLPQYFDQPQI
ncbi:hypothetical protein D6C79_09098 [Aureobasidium pullulans]|nr:hypothetical protein D6C79_09098 [Aureobasidium pullulans]